jgi:hypothetical protein
MLHGLAGGLLRAAVWHGAGRKTSSTCFFTNPLVGKCFVDEPRNLRPLSLVVPSVSVRARRPSGWSIGLGRAAVAGIAGLSCAPPPAPRAPTTSAPPAVATASTTATAVEAIPAPSAPSADDTRRGEEVERALFFATHHKPDALREACPTTLALDARARCLIDLRYEDDADSRKLARAFFDETGNLPGLLREEEADGVRGTKVKLLPARPIGANRLHLVWVASAFRDYRSTLAALSDRAPGHQLRFRDRPVEIRFFYSEGARSPSAFAAGKALGYNLRGAVNVTEDAVRDTLFHELFHLNDGWDDTWSVRVLEPTYRAIVARCAGKRACLAPHAPTETTLEGAYYSFSPGSSVREWAAEIALRYYREQRVALRSEGPRAPAFKCLATVNHDAWTLLVDEFFAGVDLTPPCP